MDGLTSDWRKVLALLRETERWFVLTGAGCSTESGIKDYRDATGRWKHAQPIQWQEFSANPAARQRYWLRSLAGWPPFAAAKPNAAHQALAMLEGQKRVHQLVTQNVDGLHRRAGSRRVLDLHGTVDRVKCMICGKSDRRSRFQQRLAELNPQVTVLQGDISPDGDAEITDRSARLTIPDCPDCGGVMRPTVVFFGEQVPKARVALAFERLTESDLMLVAGSSLMVYSGFRFARAAHAARKPLIICNRGKTRADDIATCRLDGSCGELLSRLAAELSPDRLV
jgi:NAD-dependent SIR2 family protein deacetylase